MNVLAYMSTYKRYDSTLYGALQSLVMQTFKPAKIIIYDDNPEPRDMRQVEHFRYLFQTMDQKGIPWEWVWAQKKGAHYNHEDANRRGYEYAWFIDDDHVAEPDCLAKLAREMHDGVGAVGGLIPMEFPAEPLPAGITDNKIDDIVKYPNIQWFMWDGKPRAVEHIYSSFLYRCGIVHHDLRLSSVVFRGETMFTHSLFLKGYRLLITPKAITWHYQSRGGIHSGQKQANWDHDNALFWKWLQFKRTGRPIYYLDNGLGDHYMFRQAITPEPNALVACCYPEVFPEYEVVSVADGSQLIDPKDYDVYAWCCHNNWKGTLQEAFLKLYAHINFTRK